MHLLAGLPTANKHQKEEEESHNEEAARKARPNLDARASKMEAS